jgi:hypothetical protein
MRFRIRIPTLWEFRKIVEEDRDIRKLLERIKRTL